MITINGKPYREIRCPNCRKLICYEYIFAGRVAFSCPRCNEMTVLIFKSLKTKDTDATIKNEFTIQNEQKSIVKGGE